MKTCFFLLEVLASFCLTSCGGGSSSSSAPPTTPTPATYTIGGTVSGLSGTGLVLQDNSGSNLTVTTNGAFTFSTPIASGSTYSVTVLTQPSSPAQNCVVTSGSGTVGNGNVTNISVTCTTNAPAISVSSASLTFSSQATGTTSAAQSIMVTNTGTGSLSISGATLGGANSSSFADTNGCDTSLTANATCTISVTFSPSASGSLSGDLSIVSNASSSPTAVSLYGTGVAPPSVTLTANPVIAQAGQPTTLTWSSTDAAACSAAGSWSGSQATSGASTVTSSLTPGYYTYSIECSGYGATASQSVVLTAYGLTPIAQSPPVIWYEATIQVPPPNQIIGFQTTTVVPPLPAASSNSSAFISIWPGLTPSPSSVDYLPINNGVLQPVYNFYTPFQSWVATSVYDNIYGEIPPIVDGFQTSFPDQVDGFGNFDVRPGDVLVENIVVDRTTGFWTVSLTDTTSNQSTTLVMNMEGQGQNLAVFALEIWYGMPMNNPAIFTNSTITFASPDKAGICSNSSGQSNHYVMTPPTLDSTGTKCSIAEVVLNQN